MHYLEDDIPEFALTRESVLAARKRDAVPRQPAPEHLTVGTPTTDSGEQTLHLHVLGSGSKGNCSVIEGPQGCIMIDCGFPRRTTYKRLELCGIEPERIKAMLITHEHTDHVSGAELICRSLGIPAYTTAGTATSKKAVSSIAHIVQIPHTAELDLCGMHVSVFPTSHDAADPIGLRFSLNGTQDAIAYITDTGILTQSAVDLVAGSRVIALESNHDTAMLKAGPYPAFLKARIASELGHLSNNQCGEILTSVVGPRTECVIGMHLSQTNNTPERALAGLTHALDELGSTATAAVAHQMRPISII